MSRKEFSTSVKVAAWKRCGGLCEECGDLLKPGRFQYDHDNPDGLTGEPTLDNCVVRCTPCHSEKTKQDVANIAKAKRREAKALGIRKKSTFRRVHKTKPPMTKVVPRKDMYENKKAPSEDEA
jgi:5-methylcytosine-specific restriction enzyme A